MSIGNDVRMLYRADTSQAQAAVKALRGAERDRAKEVLDGLNKENAALEASLAKWAKVGIAVGAAVGAYALLRKAHSAYLEDVRLESAAAGVNVEKLKAATRGLIEEDQLLAFAGKAKAGVWKLNQEEMERVLKGAMALRKTMGVDLQPTVEALTDSIAKGSTRALKEFGIEAKDKEGALRELDKIVKQVGGNFDMAGDDIQRAGVKAADAIDNLMGSLGRLVEKLAPAIEHLAEFLDLVSGAFGGGNKSPLFEGQAGAIRERILAYDKELQGDPGNKFLEARIAQLYKELDKLLAGEVEAATAEMLKTFDAQTDAGIAWMRDIRERGMAALAKKDAARNRARGGGGTAGGTKTFYGDYVGGGFGPEFTGLGGAGITAGGIDSATGIGAVPDAGADRVLGREMLRAQQMLAAQAEAERRKKLFESVFGSPDEITATATALNLAHTAVDGMTGAIAQSFEAWVTGAESAGDVFKRVVAGFVHNMGVELAQVGAKHLILAAVDAATLNFPGAALHASAAGIALAGSAGFFTLASSMGYGKQAPSAGARGGGAGYAVGGGVSRGGGSGSGDSSVTINIWDTQWDDRTPGQRKSALARAVKEGQQTRTSNIVLHR